MGTASAGFFRDGDTYRWSGNTTYQVQPVPERSTLLLLGSGVAALGRARWRRMRGR